MAGHLGETVDEQLGREFARPRQQLRPRKGARLHPGIGGARYLAAQVARVGVGGQGGRIGPIGEVHAVFPGQTGVDLLGEVRQQVPQTLDRAERWLNERVHQVPSRTTGEQPTDRLVLERPFLGPLPRVRFDTDYVETRRVHNIVPFISVDGVRYSVPPNVLGQLVEIRRPVDSDSFEVRWAGTVVARHQLASGDVAEVWADDHRRASVAEALGRHDRRRDRHLRAVADQPADDHETSQHDEPIDAHHGLGDR